MISKIGPSVRVGEKNRYRPVALHLLGGATGGAVSGIVLGFAGTILALIVPTQTLSLASRAALVGALVVGGLVDLRLLSLDVNLNRQTPDAWACAFGSSPTALAWGFDLGLGFTTRLPCKTLIALPVFVVFTQSLGVAVLVMTLYGATRAAVASVAIIAARGDYVEMCDRIIVRHIALRTIAGCAGLLSAAFVLSAT